MIGTDADLKIVSFSVHHWDFIKKKKKKKNCLRVWNRFKKPFYATVRSVQGT